MSANMGANGEGPQFLCCPDGQSIAYLRHQSRDSTGAGVIFLGGFRSDMSGTKAQALHDWAKRTDRNFLRFDYFGHGASSGDFLAGSITRWCNDSLAVIDALSEGPQILVGSSMGGWLALLAAKARLERIKALILIAPAPDFTERLMWASFTPAIRQTILNKNVWYQPSVYSTEPTPITRLLIEDGRKHLLLDGPVTFTKPVRILQGMADADVPWRHAALLAERLTSSDVILSLIKDGDHRLSTPQNLEHLIGVVEKLYAYPHQR